MPMAKMPGLARYNRNKACRILAAPKSWKEQAFFHSE